MKKTLIELMTITLGAFAFALGINMFVIPHELGEGGVVGITINLYYLMGWSPGWTSLIINMLLLAAGYRLLKKQTILYTIIAVSLHSLFLHLTQGWYFASNDLMINSITGGALIGCGIGLIVRVGGTTAGTVIIAKIINKFWGWNISYALLFCDVIVAISSYFIIGPERLIYTIIMLIVATKIMDFVIAGLNPTKSITIVSTKQDQIAQQISNLMDRGVTILRGQGYYTKSTMDILYVVVNKNELSRLKKIIISTDHEAFMTIHHVQDAFGKGFEDIRET